MELPPYFHPGRDRLSCRFSLIWKFTYFVGQSGGAAFVFVYLMRIALIGLPMLVAERLLGRRGQKNRSTPCAN